MDIPRDEQDSGNSIGSTWGILATYVENGITVKVCKPAHVHIEHRYTVLPRGPRGKTE